MIVLVVLTAPFLGAQDADSPSSPPPSNESLPLFDPDAAEPGDAGASGLTDSISPEPVLSIWDFVRMIVVLLGVIGVIYLLFLLLKRGTQGRLVENRAITILGSRALQGGKAMHLIQVGRQIFLVGVGDDAVNLISEVTDPESLDLVRLDADQAAPQARRTFADLVGDLLGATRPAAQPATTAGTTVATGASRSGEAFARGDIGQVSGTIAGGISGGTERPSRQGDDTAGFMRRQADRLRRMGET